MNEVFAFECFPANMPEWTHIINARSRGKAKAEYFRDVNESWDVPYTAIRCHKIGPPHTSFFFERNAVYRKLPNAKCGDRVIVGESAGVITGHDQSANFEILFDDDAPKYAGLKLSVHPNSITEGPAHVHD